MRGPAGPRLLHRVSRGPSIPLDRLLDGVLGAAERLLGLTGGLVHLALGLGLRVAGHLPGHLLDAALHFLSGTGDTILVHGTSSSMLNSHRQQRGAPSLATLNER